MDELNQRMESLEARMDKRMEELEARLNLRFDQQDRRFDQQDKRMEEMEGRLNLRMSEVKLEVKALGDKLDRVLEGLLAARA